MNLRTKIVLLLCLLQALPATVDGLKCFQCRSDTDKNCASSPPNGHLKECVAQPAATTTTPTPTTTTGEPDAETEKSARRRKRASAASFKCRKISQTLYVTDPYETIVFRECATLYGQDQCNETSNKLFEQFVCDCSDDACNSATPKTTAIADRRISTLIVCLLYFFN